MSDFTHGYVSSVTSTTFAARILPSGPMPTATRTGPWIV